MKRLTLLLVLAAWSTVAWPQNSIRENNYELQTIFSKDRSNGGYGAFTIGYSRIDGKDAIISGARGAFILKHSLSIGIGGYGFVNDLNYRHYIDEVNYDYTMAGGYGGIFIEPIIAPRYPVHISFPVLFGIGGVSLVEGGNWWEQDIFNNMDNDVFLVLEPAMEIEFNLTKFLRTAVALSYRFTSDIELFETQPDVLEGFMVGLTFKMGKF